MCVYVRTRAYVCVHARVPEEDVGRPALSLCLTSSFSQDLTESGAGNAANTPSDCPIILFRFYRGARINEGPHVPTASCMFITFTFNFLLHSLFSRALSDARSHSSQYL